MRKKRTDTRTVEIPPCANPARRDTALKSLYAFGMEYFSNRFYSPCGEAHRKFAAEIERTVRKGGNHARAMPRGSGKTTWVEVGVIYAILGGFRQYVVAIAGTKALSDVMLESIKGEFETNEKLAEDFPWACVPVQKLEGVSIRAKTMLARGENGKPYPIAFSWGSGHIEMPNVSGASGAGAFIDTVGIDGHIRGRKRPRKDGSSARPDLAIVDDPQTRESANSAVQCASRIKTINGDVLGLSGPGKKIAALIACTVISRGDVADQLLNRTLNPVWGGEKTPMLISKSAKHDDLWLGEYAELRRECQRNGDMTATAATQFYLEHLDAMDDGAKVYWEERYNPDELSATQNAYNLLIDYGEEVFQAEYQNDPIRRAATTYEITPEIVASKVNSMQAREIPMNAPFLVIFVDVMSAEGLHWVAVAFRNDLTGMVVGYGAHPGGGRKIWDASNTAETEDQAIYRNLDELTAMLARENEFRREGAPAKIDLLLIDSGYRPDVVFQFCRHSRHGIRVVPSRGRAAKSYKPARVVGAPGDGWFMTEFAGKGRVLVHNADHHRMGTQQAFLLTPGAPGSISLYGVDKRQHWLFGEHIASERLQEHIRGDVTDHYAWTMTPGTVNHWLDCVVGCRAGACFCGAGVGKLVAKPVQNKQKPVQKPKQETRRWW